MTNPPADNPADKPVGGSAAADHGATDETQAIPPADNPQPQSAQAGAQSGAQAAPPPPPPAGNRRTGWYRRLPGRPGIWLAAFALVVACVIGCCGFIAGAVVSHGGERGGDHRISRDGRWGDQRGPGGWGEQDGRNGPEHRRGPKVVPPGVPAPAQPTPAQPAPTPPVTPSPTAPTPTPTA